MLHAASAGAACKEVRCCQGSAQQRDRGFGYNTGWVLACIAGAALEFGTRGSLQQAELLQCVIRTLATLQSGMTLQALHPGGLQQRGLRHWVDIPAPTQRPVQRRWWLKQLPCSDGRQRMPTLPWPPCWCVLPALSP